MDIGKRLRELRSAKGWSQYEMEKRTGILRCNIWRIEKGRKIPSLETMETMAQALEVELYKIFLEGEGEQQAAVLRKLSMLHAERRQHFESLEKLYERGMRLLIGLG